MNNLSEPVFWYQEKGELFAGSREDFKQVTGSFWTSELKGDLAVFPGISPNLSGLEVTPYLLSLYESSLDIPPSLYIKKSPYPGMNTLHAQKEILPGEFITEYLGVWEPYSNTSSSYRWGPINGEHFRNYGAMIDDGFPNVQAFYIFDCQGAPLRVIFVALETIPRDGIITTNYGMGHSVKIGRRSEHRKQVMVSYFTTHPIDATAKTIREGIGKRKSGLEFNQLLELEDKAAKLQYLFQTPSALLYLLLEKVVTVKEVFDFYDKIDNRLYLLGFYAAKNWREKEISSCIERLRGFSSSERYSFLRPLLENVPVLELFEMLV